MVSIGTIGGFVNSRNILTIHGLSTDEKPIGEFQNCKIGNSSVFIEMDTNKEYWYDEENREWVDKMTYIVGGDGSGSSGTTEKEIVIKTSADNFPATGKTGILYIDKTNKLIYMWNADEGEYELYGDGNAELDTLTSEELEQMWGND